MPKKYATLSWHDETVPISDKFDDAYYSLENGAKWILSITPMMQKKQRTTSMTT